MSNSPLVSVVIPCYNYGRFLAEAVDSIDRQTYSNCEIVIVDDGSDQETLKVVAGFENRGRCRVLCLSHGGPSRARNAGIEAAQGKYILPLDADDRIAPSYVEKAVALMEADPALGIVSCRAEFFGSQQGPWDLPEYSFPEVLLDNCIFVTSVFRREAWKAVGGFDESFRDEWEDYDFWLSLIERGATVKKIPEVLFFYRRGHAGRSTRTGRGLLPLYTQLFHKHSELYARNIEVLFLGHIRSVELQGHVRDLERQIWNLRNSRSFRLGHFLLHPWTIFR